MSSASAASTSIYRQPLLSGTDDLFTKCLTATSIAGAPTSC